MMVEPLPLRAHPASRPLPVQALDAMAFREEGWLVLVFQIQGGLDHLRIPPLGPIRRGANLWESTCFEAFLRPVGGEAYVELNLAPSAAWDAQAFVSYRRKLRSLDVDPDVRLRRGGDLLALRARLPLEALPGCDTGGPLDVNLAAVLEDREGNRAYACLNPVGDRPDFHAPEGFVLRLEGGRP